MAKWRTVGIGRLDETQDEREFRNQGPLVSLAREPPQNSTDNRLDSEAPVVLRYSFREIPCTTFRDLDAVNARYSYVGFYFGIGEDEG